MEFIKQLLSGDQTRRSPRDSTSSSFKKFNGKSSKLCKLFSETRSEPQDDGSQSPSKRLESINDKFNDCAWGSRYQLDKKTLIFDLDNTLIYASKDIPDADKYTHISFEKEGEYFVRYIVKRPGLLKFLKKLSKVFNICIFTSAEETYAKKVIEATKISKYIYTVYDRTHCKKVGEFLYVKNIWNLGFQKDQAVLIDDLDMQMECQPENGLNIKAFEGEECDRELYKLYPFLQKMSETSDVRPAQKNFNDHMKRELMMKKEDGEYSDGCEVDFDEGCVRTSVKGSCCPTSMLNRSSTNLCLLETSLSSTSSKSQTDGEN